VPGVALCPRRYFVFASNLSGDAYCIDGNLVTPEGHHPVVMFAHDSIGEDTEHEDILAARLQVASCLEEFLLSFATGALIDEPQYP
jgi:hypothetical protein